MEILQQQPLNLQHPLNRGLVGRWQVLPTQATGSPTWRDLIGKNHGTRAGGVTTLLGSNRRGGFGTLYNPVVGASNYVTLGTGNVAAFYSLTQFTVMGWLRWDTTGVRQDSIAIWNTGSTQKFLLTYHIPTANKPGFYISTGSSPSGLSATTTPAAGDWVHCCGTYDGTTNNLYINGLLEATGSPGITLSTAAAPFTISKSDGSATNLGAFDDVRLYGRVLSASEVLQVYRFSRLPYDPTLNWIDRIVAKPGAAGGSFQPAWARGSNVVLGSGVAA